MSLELTPSIIFILLGSFVILRAVYFLVTRNKAFYRVCAQPTRARAHDTLENLVIYNVQVLKRKDRVVNRNVWVKKSDERALVNGGKEGLSKDNPRTLHIKKNRFICWI